MKCLLRNSSIALVILLSASKPDFAEAVLLNKTFTVDYSTNTTNIMGNGTAQFDTVTGNAFGTLELTGDVPQAQQTGLWIPIIACIFLCLVPDAFALDTSIEDLSGNQLNGSLNADFGSGEIASYSSNILGNTAAITGNLSGVNLQSASNYYLQSTTTITGNGAGSAVGSGTSELSLSSGLTPFLTSSNSINYTFLGNTQAVLPHDILVTSSATISQLSTTIYQFTGNVSAETFPVPVPATFWLFSSGLIGLIGFSRRKK